MGKSGINGDAMDFHGDSFASQTRLAGRSPSNGFFLLVCPWGKTSNNGGF